MKPTKFEDLKKIYLFTHGDKFSFSHIDAIVRAVGENIFQLLAPPGIYPETIDKTMPVFNYGNNEEIAKLIKDGVIDKKNVYNQPENLVNANSKVEFHKKTKDLKFIPKTVFTKEDALKSLKFPIIAKPDTGSKGQGIDVFKTKEDLEKADGEYQVFSEKFDLVKEFRVISINGNIIFIAERIPENKKAKSLRESDDIFDRSGTLDDRSSYRWEKVRFGKNGIPEEDKFQKIAESVNKALKLEFLGVDIGLDSKGKLFCIEGNTCPGLNKDQVVLIYEYLFKDFYGRVPNKESQIQLDAYKKELMRANKDKAKFTFSPHLGKRFYDYDNYIDHKGEQHGEQKLGVKFDLEKSFGSTMQDLKKKYKISEGMNHLTNFKDFIINEAEFIAPEIKATSRQKHNFIEKLENEVKNIKDSIKEIEGSANKKYADEQNTKLNIYGRLLGTLKKDGLDKFDEAYKHYLFLIKDLDYDFLNVDDMKEF